MVRASRIARRGTDAAVLLTDQRLIGQLLARSIGPEGGADVLVQALGEGFGEAIGKGLQQDVRVIVVVGLEAGEVLDRKSVV